MELNKGSKGGRKGEVLNMCLDLYVSSPVYSLQYFIDKELETQINC